MCPNRRYLLKGGANTGDVHMRDDLAGAEIFHHAIVQIDASSTNADEINMGSFFALSGFHKLTNKERHKTFQETLRVVAVANPVCLA